MRSWMEEATAFVVVVKIEQVVVLIRVNLHMRIGGERLF
jgi:hypothetical protein